MRKRSGVSLAELMISIVILSIYVLLLMGMFSAGSVQMRKSRATATASFLAKQKMEEILTQDEISNSQGTFETPFTDYRYEVNVKDYEDGSLLKQIEIHVTTPKSLGGKRIELVMLKAI